MYTINTCAHSITYSYTLHTYSYHIYTINKCRRGDKSSKPDGRTLENKCRRNFWKKKSPLEPHSIDFCRQDPWLNAEIIRQNFGENVFHMTAKHFPQIFTNYWGGFNICL